MRSGPPLLHVGEPFPPVDRADPEGLVAVGGALNTARVLSAYRRGIFPWPLLGPGQQVLWFSPDPRFVLEPKEVRVGRSLRKVLRRDRYRVTCDRRFAEVVARCARAPRSGQSGTWITPELEAAFHRLHRLGFAHSVEVWSGDGSSAGSQADGHDELVGGLYGLALGSVFFGESMFSLRSNASKIAFAVLARRLADSGFRLIDCQQETDHLARFGARAMPRSAFVESVGRWVDEPPTGDVWSGSHWA